MEQAVSYSAKLTADERSDRIHHHGGLLLDYHWLVLRAGGGKRHGLAGVPRTMGARRRSQPAWRSRHASLIATAGEIFLSLVWGLYQYRLDNIPLFVPPGHVLLFYLRHADRVAHARCARRPGSRRLAAALTAVLACSGRDTLGPLLLALFFPCLWLSPSRKLYATMFVLSRGDGALRHLDRQLDVVGREVPWLGLAHVEPAASTRARSTACWTCWSLP